MRLDTASQKQPQSPSHACSNGSSQHSRSPGSRSALGRTSNGSSHEHNGTVAANGHANDRPLPTSYFGHDREEVTRILIQSLTDLGYGQSAELLSQESGCELEGPTVASFRNAVLEGEWDKAEALLFGTPRKGERGGVDLRENGAENGTAKARGKAPIFRPSSPGGVEGLRLCDGADRTQMKFWIKRQKYLELLENRDLGAALLVLRHELQPLQPEEQMVHPLASYIMCVSAEEVKQQAQWDGASGESRKQLLSELSKFISPTVMIPEHRLANLLDQIKDHWIAKCLYHNTTQSPSLYVDHVCNSERFPRKTVAELCHQTDEIWFLKYSNDGSMLATASKDRTVCIYDTSTYHYKRSFTNHESGVCYVAWSPNDKYLITCTHQTENAARLWDVATGTCVRRIDHFTYPVSCAAWAPNGETYVIGSQDILASITSYSLDQQSPVHTWSGQHIRVHDLAISPDGQLLVVLLEKQIIVYDYHTTLKLHEYTLDGVKLTSVAITKDSQHMLVSMNDNKIHVMSIATGAVLQSYTGHKQTNFIIRSSLGGADENFVVSGSEDSNVYIWKANGQLINALPGHQGCVNSVAWHPTDPTVFASAGDDHRVRIWAPDASPRFFGSSSYAI